jgi:hypothetical protein
MDGDTVWYRAAVESWLDPALKLGGSDRDTEIVMDSLATSQPVSWRPA